MARNVQIQFKDIFPSFPLQALLCYKSKAAKCIKCNALKSSFWHNAVRKLFYPLCNYVTRLGDVLFLITMHYSGSFLLNDEELGWMGAEQNEACCYFYLLLYICVWCQRRFRETAVYAWMSACLFVFCMFLSKEGVISQLWGALPLPVLHAKQVWCWLSVSAACGTGTPVASE